MGPVTDATPSLTRSPATAAGGRARDPTASRTWKSFIRAGARCFKGVRRERYNPPVELTERQRRHLKGLAHHLNPVVRIGNAGVSPSVVAETRRALADHELIKVRVTATDRDERDAAIALLAGECDCALVGRVGHVAILYRAHPDRPRILLPAGEPG